MVRDGAEPAVFKGVDPAWNDENLREIAGRITTPVLFAHIRASTGTPVQRSNCHPFRHGRWLWMHNGAIRGFHEIKRDLLLAVDPSLFLDIEGSTDSETLFFLALTFGLADDPFAAVARAVGLVEKVGREHGIEYPMQMTVATTDGESVWAFRYSSEGQSRSLFFSTDVCHVASTASRRRDAAQSGRRDPAGGLRTSRRSAGSLERSARVLGRSGPSGHG